MILLAGRLRGRDRGAMRERVTERDIPGAHRLNLAIQVFAVSPEANGPAAGAVAVGLHRAQRSHGPPGPQYPGRPGHQPGRALGVGSFRGTLRKVLAERVVE